MSKQKKADRRLEVALTVYQTIEDIHKNSLDGMIEVKNRCYVLLNDVLTVLEDVMESSTQ